MNIDWSKAPEDATHAGNSPYEKGVITWFKGIRDPASRNYFMNEGSMNAWAISSENLSAWDLIERPKKQEAWDGEGLPPVGTVCDMHIDDFGWITGTVVVHIDLDEPTAVAHNAEEVFHGNASDFRPIKTPEQLAAEELERTRKIGVAQMMEHIHFSLPKELWGECEPACYALYEAGYRKK